MKKIYVLPQLIDWLILNNAEIQNFVFRLNEINIFFINQKNQLGYKIIIDFYKVQEFDELGLYDIRMFSSLLLDGNSFFGTSILPPNYENYSYYTVPNIAGLPPKETFENIHIELAKEDGKGTRVFNFESANHVLLKYTGLMLL
ncbi:MAG: hypothetical protein IPP96_01435 [Chitinophagaceae bacterium]|nr:hypothetical protein [Chitinophagaceae bacterium]